MQETQRTYIAIDLKSFYASVECVDRGLDPLTTNLVVCQPDRENHLPGSITQSESLWHRWTRPTVRGRSETP